MWRACALVAAVVVAAGCGSGEPSTSSPKSGGAEQPGKGKPTVTIGTKDFTEEFLLGELYAGALEAKGYTVNLKKDIGATEIVDKALTSGGIDGYPEYTGVAVAAVAKHDELTKSAEETTQLAREFYEKRGQAVSDPTPFQDTDGLATSKRFATKHHLRSVGDLKDVPGFELGAPPEFKSRFTGLRGMEKVYGVKDVSFKPLAIGLQYPALDKGKVDAANVFSTDAQLSTGKYTLLEDPEGVFGYQNVLFVIDQDKLDALGGDAFMDVINSVNALLTRAAMQKMNAAVDLDKRDPAGVARSFLQANGLS
jgi:osmoprotectant transport system substrate-binding protein